jgi:hypothetical protein
MFHMLMERKRESTISMAVSRDRVVSIRVVNLVLDIRHAPFVDVCHERSVQNTPLVAADADKHRAQNCASSGGDLPSAGT